MQQTHSHTNTNTHPHINIIINNYNPQKAKKKQNQIKSTRITKLKNDEQALKIVFASSERTKNTLYLITYLRNLKANTK